MELACVSTARQCLTKIAGLTQSASFPSPMQYLGRAAHLLSDSQGPTISLQLLIWFLCCFCGWLAPLEQLC